MIQRKSFDMSIAPVIRPAAVFATLQPKIPPKGVVHNTPKQADALALSPDRPARAQAAQPIIGTRSDKFVRFLAMGTLSSGGGALIGMVIADFARLPMVSGGWGGALIFGVLGLTALFIKMMDEEHPLK